MKCKTTVWDADPNYLLRRCRGRARNGEEVIDLDVLPPDADDPASMQDVDDGLIASTRLKPRSTHLRVGYIEVHPDHRKKQYGTRLYERALIEACAQGLPLSSDTQRSEFSEAFWRKQVAKGRARCVPGEGEYWSGPRVELEEALDAGRISASEYRRMIDSAPEPGRDADGAPVWPCQRYEITKDPCVPQSLAGVRKRKRKK
ncbi:MAG: GNAT family N-acetyltransferase [Microbacterium sp.]